MFLCFLIIFAHNSVTRVLKKCPRSEIRKFELLWPNSQIEHINPCLHSSTMMFQISISKIDSHGCASTVHFFGVREERISAASTKLLTPINRAVSLRPDAHNQPSVLVYCATSAAGRMSTNVLGRMSTNVLERRYRYASRRRPSIWPNVERRRRARPTSRRAQAQLSLMSAAPADGQHWDVFFGIFIGTFFLGIFADRLSVRYIISRVNNKDLGKISELFFDWAKTVLRTMIGTPKLETTTRLPGDAAANGEFSIQVD